MEMQLARRRKECIWVETLLTGIFEESGIGAVRAWLASGSLLEIAEWHPSLPQLFQKISSLKSSGNVALAQLALRSPAIGRWR